MIYFRRNHGLTFELLEIVGTGALPVIGARASTEWLYRISE